MEKTDWGRGEALCGGPYIRGYGVGILLEEMEIIRNNNSSNNKSTSKTNSP